MKTIRDQVLDVMRDGSRIDRFLEITCVDDQPCELFLTTEDTSRVQFRVPVADGLTDDEEEQSAADVVEQARDYLMKNA